MWRLAALAGGLAGAAAEFRVVRAQRDQTGEWYVDWQALQTVAERIRQADESRGMSIGPQDGVSTNLDG